MPLYSIPIHYFAEVLPRLFCCSIFKVAVALVFTAVLQIFTRGGREVGARGKDEVLPQPDGSILSGGTVVAVDISFFYNAYKYLYTNRPTDRAAGRLTDRLTDRPSE